MNEGYFQKAQEFQSVGTPFVTVTMVATRGHAPQDPGAKAIMSAKGLEWGTVGGGRVEAKAIVHAQDLLKDLSRSNMELVTWNLQRDVGMSCGGEVQFLFERVVPHSWKVAVFGAGHVSQSLVRLLLTLDCQVYCIDNREEWMSRLPKDNPKLIVVPCTEYSDALPQIPENAFCVVMTRGHATDLPVLDAILKKRIPPYIGVIGSEVKAIKIRKDLADLGVSSEAVEALRCPMGVPISNRNDPAEIAVSITAELISVREQSSS